MGLCDVIEDIVEDIVDAIVDVVDTIVDVVVGVIDIVLSPIANLLGFEDGETDANDVELFEIHNQALFAEPDKKASAETVVNAVIAGNDISEALRFAALFKNGKQNVRKFIKFIDDGDYFEDFPVLKGNVMTVDYDEVDSVLTTLNSAPATITNAKLGTLFVNPWQKYWLQENKAYVHETSTFTHSGTATVVNVSNSVYNSSSNNYTLRTGSPLANFTAFNIPSKPTGLHYIVNYYLDSAPSVNKLFVYKVGAGTYSGLDDPNTQITTTGTDTLSVLPAIPLRLNNTNFNASGQNTSKRDKIIALADTLGLDAEDIIAKVMEDVAATNIANYQNKVDHVYLNFGVRVWDTAQTSMNYGFRFISTLFPGQGVTKAIYDSTPSSDDKPYNTILVTQGDYKLAFTWAYITFANYTLTAINNAGAGSEIYEKYYSDSSKFTGGYLNSTYYASSGIQAYNVGYFVSNATELAAYIAGTHTQESSFSSEAADWMQPTQGITFTGTIINSDNTISTSGEVKPSEIYELVSNTTQLITSNTTYYPVANSPTLKIEISGGGGAGGGAKAGSGSGQGGSSGGTTQAKVYNASGALLNTYSASGGAGGSADNGGTSIGETGESFGGPGSNGVPSGAHSSFSGSGGAGGNNGGGSNASGKSAGGGGGGDNAGTFDFDVDRFGRNGDRGTYYTTNHTFANSTDYVVITIGGGGSGGGSNAGGSGTSGNCVLTPLSVTAAVKKINKANETTTTGTSFTYYQNVVNGMNAYTIHSPKTMLRVIDAQTSKFKMVNFDLTDPTGLMIPFSYEVIKSLPNDHVTSLVTASAHISLYVADVQIIEQPTWVKLLKIVQVVLFIMALISGQLAIAEALKAMIKQIIISLVIEKIVVTIAKEISPELALVVAVAIGYQLSGGKTISFTSFKDLGDLIANTTDLIASVVETTVEGLQDDLTAEWDAEKERQESLEDQLAELNEEYSPNTIRHLSNLVNVNMQSTINPMMPTEYLAYYNNFNVLGFEDYNYDNTWDVLYETQVMQT
tara:strand:+ start:486 stop:3551 length:3066 start_codon:yes stop_codon:yes gene_type:complete